MPDSARRFATSCTPICRWRWAPPSPDPELDRAPEIPGAFIFLLPGVTEGNRWGQINGAQGFSKDVFIEGVPITDPIQQGEGRTIALGVSVEAVEQFQVETSGTGVEFNGQGSENYTIKSGRNQFHGSGFEYLRNTVLDASGFFPAIRPRRTSKRIRFYHRRPDHQEEGFLLLSRTTAGVIESPVRRNSYPYRP